MFDIAAIALTTALVAASPALAADPIVVATTSNVPVGPPAAKPTRYCVVATLTGTNIPRKTCRSRAAWLAEGFDPVAK